MADSESKDWINVSIEVHLVWVMHGPHEMMFWVSLRLSNVATGRHYWWGKFTLKIAPHQRSLGNVRMWWMNLELDKTAEQHLSSQSPCLEPVPMRFTFPLVLAFFFSLLTTAFAALSQRPIRVLITALILLTGFLLIMLSAIAPT